MTTECLPKNPGDCPVQPLGMARPAAGEAVQGERPMLDAMLRDAAAAYVQEHAIASLGDVVTTTWGGWKNPGRVRITHIGAHLVCRWNGKDDWLADFEMEYCGQRVRADGSVPAKAGHLCLMNLVTRDGRRWAPTPEPGGRTPGFNHAGLSWGTFRTQRTSGAGSADATQPKET